MRTWGNASVVNSRVSYSLLRLRIPHPMFRRHLRHLRRHRRPVRSVAPLAIERSGLRAKSRDEGYTISTSS